MPEQLPTGWIETTLGMVCAMNPRMSLDEPLSDGTEVSFVPMAAVEEESGRLDASQIRAIGSVRRGYTPFIENDVLFAKITPCMENGKIALATGLKNGLGYGSTEFFVFRPYSGLLPQFVLHFLLQPSLREDAERQMTGASGQKRVPANYLFTHEFLLPPIREQERIVARLNAALSAVERAEIAARQAQRRLNQYRDAVIDAAVSGELSRPWREAQKNQRSDRDANKILLQRLLVARRDCWEEAEKHRHSVAAKAQKGDTRKRRYRESTPPQTDGLPKLPNGWDWISIDQLAWNSGYGTSAKCTYEGKGPAVLRIPNIRNRTIDPTDLKFASSFLDFTDEDFIAPGDLLLIRTNGSRNLIGRVAIAKARPAKKYSYASYLIRFRLVGDETIWSWVSLTWDSNMIRSSIESRAATTAGQYNVSLSGLADLAIPLPSIEEQAEIIREVERRFLAADRLAATLEQQLTRARAARKSILCEAFSGRLVPQNSDDEPASVLLESIRKEAAQRQSARKTSRRQIQRTTEKRSDSMRDQPPPSTESLSAAWNRIGKIADASHLFDEAGYRPEHVVQFYEALRAIPELRLAFQQAAPGDGQQQNPITHVKEEHEQPNGRFRLVELWLEDFKNLKDYTVRFDPSQGTDIILGWNGTGKSNLIEALVIVFRDLHDWWEKNRWPDKPMNGFRLIYEMNEHTVEATWRPGQMKRPELKRGPIDPKTTDGTIWESIKREELPLPRFIFGYYSGPTNRLAEHFLPMKQAHYVRLREAKSDDPQTLAKLLEQRRFFCAETHHAKYVLLAFSYKEDQKIKEFLENRLRIVGFESALFVIRKPRWAKPGSVASNFWGATGIMRRVMERLRHYAIAPMVLKQTVSYGYRSATEDHYYFFLPDIDSLHSFAADYQDARTFFLALESTDFSELIHDVKIQVRVKSTATEEVPITFHQLSEGEQQLLMVLGLMRFTKSHQSLVLLDEPDTHLNPHWSVDYLKDLAYVMSDNTLESTEQQTSQIVMATHDPLVIASLVKEQIHLLKRDPNNGVCKWEPAGVNPRGLGFTGILTSEMFGFRSDLDAETLADLDSKVRLFAKQGSLSAQEKEELKNIDKHLADAGFSKAFSDPYYSAFVRAWGRRHSQLMAGLQFVTPEKRQEIDRIASEVLKEAVAEVEKKVGI